ncbi:MAG: MCE family protein [Candidatus Eisenbacteria bacterium]|uniref:MCE family protein n=1 Tax=Eiseniibacteriota bacterium TaxID=2212470 RepID=A0A538T311_UNCEI|nr:MAG: MCE family protein [Candidatus Eisenbacteria bacterium]
MKRTGRVPFMRLQIGFWVLVAFGLLLWATFQSGSLKFFGREEKIDLTFSSVGGLEEGASVRLNGVPVGHVRDISLERGGNNVVVELGVKPGTRERLHIGATARITSVGFLAELYVELNGGDPNQPIIRDDREIAVTAATDPQVAFKKVQSITDSLEVLLGNLNVAGRALGSGRGTLGRLASDERLYQQLVELSRNANMLATKIDVNQSRVSDQLVSLAASLDSLAQKMQHGPGTIAQLMNDATLHQKLASSTARADSILGAIASGHGTFGRLYSDSTLYDDTKALMASMKRLMAEIEKNPKKYFKFSIF